MQKLHFISGLPRSGSTLLAALLRQNPRVQAGMSGPMFGLVKGMLEGMSAKNEYSVFISDDQRKKMLTGLFESYYENQADKQVIFDTSRGWCAQMPLIADLYPESKVIACVRDVSWIVDSVESLVQRNIFSPSSIFNYDLGGTVYTRSDGVANGTGMLGYAYNALKEAFYGAHTKRLMLVQYESLVTKPVQVLKTVYDFIDEPYFAHEVKKIEFDASDFDKKSGTPGLHAIRPAVSASKRETILPPDVFNRFRNDAFWLKPELNLHSVKII